MNLAGAYVQNAHHYGKVPNMLKSLMSKLTQARCTVCRTPVDGATARRVGVARVCSETHAVEYADAMPW